MIAPPLPAKAPSGKDHLPELPRLDRLARQLQRLGIAVVEVDGEEQVVLRRLRQQGIRFPNVKGQRLFHEQRIARLDDLERRGNSYFGMLLGVHQPD
jgi:hypothetical protein